MTPYVRRRVDCNQHLIVSALRDAGCSVQSLATVGHGVPDLLVARAGRLFLMEVKVGKAKLTPDELEWHATWRSTVWIVRSIEDALKAVGL